MKKFTAVCLMLLILIASFTASALAETPADVLLMTTYVSMGNYDRIMVGVLDSDGSLYTYASDDPGSVPYKPAELLEWAKTADMELIGSIKSKRLDEIRSLIVSLPAEEPQYLPVADDAGNQTSYAVSKDRSGNAEIIVLGASGDELYENTDPGAQALYSFLRSAFPDIPAFVGDELMAPKGFEPVSLLDFTGNDGIDLTDTTLVAYWNDCEAGPAECEVDKTAEELIALTVTGKRNSLFTTGNTTTYCFIDADGTTVAAFEFYDGLLVAQDGMYSVS